MDHHVRCPKETMLHLPTLVPARSADRLASTSVSKPGLPGSSPEEKAKEWRESNPDYFIARRILDRGKADRVPEPLRLPRPLRQLPWDIAQFQFGVQGTDFIGVLGTVLLRGAQSQFEAYLTDSARVPGTLPLSPEQSQRTPVAPSGRGDPGYEAGVSPTGPPT